MALFNCCVVDVVALLELALVDAHVGELAEFILLELEGLADEGLLGAALEFNFLLLIILLDEAWEILVFFNYSKYAIMYFA